jgi:hypothetical protein
MELQKVVIPAQAGIQVMRNELKILAPRFDGNDENECIRTFCELVKTETGN